MISALRILALVCGIAFLLIGWVWAYWIAVIGWIAGAIGWGLLVWAARCEKMVGGEVTLGQARLAAGARWLILLSAAVSLAALVIVLVAN